MRKRSCSRGGIGRLLEPPEHAVAFPGDRKNEAMKELVNTFHQNSSFRTAESRCSTRPAVKQAALAVLAAGA